MNQLKNMIPDIYDGDLQKWRAWKEDAEDYMDTANAGMRKLLKEVEAEDATTLVADTAIHRGRGVYGKVRSSGKGKKGKRQGPVVDEASSW